MRILNVMLSRRRGGLERAVRDAHEGLTLAGCTVTSVFQPDAWIRSHWPSDFSSHPLRSLGTWDPLAKLALARLVSATSFDVILCHGDRAVRTARWARAKAPVIAVCHTTNYNVLKSLRHIDGAIALNAHYQNILVASGLPKARTRVVPNAIRIGPEPAAPFKSETPTIGGLGRLAPNKGFDVLVEACAILAREGKTVRCVIGGTDQHGSVQGLEACRSDAGLTHAQLELPGWIEDPSGFLRSLDVFCMPSRREVFSIALLEALEFGRPVICTRMAGMTGVFQDGVEGFFVDIDDPVGLAKAISQILDDPERGRRMGAAARRRAGDFDLPVVGERLKAALQGLIAKTSAE